MSTANASALGGSNFSMSIAKGGAMTKPLMSIQDISVSFDGFRALSNLNLNISENELRMIIGPNGAGKTTLLDVICGKTKPTSGKVMFKEKDLTTLPAYRIVRVGVARKFQTPSVYEDLTVRENFEISLSDGRGVLGSLFFRRTPRVHELIGGTAEQVFLSDLLNMRAKHLSHGQKQWLEIGMMLVQDPELLLLDEPVAGMSAREREQTAELLEQISRRKALIVIEHDMDFVRKIGKKITVMHQGSILCEGSIDDVQRDERVIEVYLGA